MQPLSCRTGNGMNLGIGIVVPAPKIIETINNTESSEWRSEFEEQFSRDRTPESDLGKK
jgi:hypothetical protein